MNAGRLESSFAARFAAVAIAFSALFASALSPAAELPIFVGSIGVGKAKPELANELRALLRAELASAEFSSVRSNERYTLSATLVRLDSIQGAESVRATCVVSVAVLRDGSTLHALISGRATAEEAKAPAARSDALRGAVHSAMVRVPKALR